MSKSLRIFFRIICFVLIAVLLLLVGTQLCFTFYLNEKIKNDLQEQVLAQTDKEYILEIEKLTTNIFTQSVFVEGFLLRPSKTIDSLSAKYFASASEINLVDCSLFSFLFRKNLTISKIELVNPAGYIYRSTLKNSPKKNESQKKFSIYSLISKNIRELKINEFKIQNAHFSLYDDINDTIPSLASEDNELEIKNLRINNSIEESGRLFYADKMNLLINRFTYTTRDSLYSFEVKQLRASYIDSTVVIDSVKMIPNYSKKQFSAEAGKQTDRMNLTVSELDFAKMNVKLFFERNWFIAQNLKIKGMNLTAFRNKNYIRKNERIAPVQELLKDIPIYTAIQKIELINAEVVYEEIVEGGSEVGKVSFNKLNAEISGFTSDTSLFAEYKTMKIDASAKFMNIGKLNAHYTFPLNTSEAVFDCSGRLDNLPLKSINAILIPSANISIEDGQVDSLIFNFHANNSISKGKLYFYYHGLKIEFLNKKSHKSGKFQEVLSFLAHKLLIREDNPAKGKSLRVTDINYERDPNRFVFNYSWKSLLSGIKPAIGIPGKTK